MPNNIGSTDVTLGASGLIGREYCVEGDREDHQVLVDIGGYAANLFYLGPGHTDGDLLRDGHHDLRRGSRGAEFTALLPVFLSRGMSRRAAAPANNSCSPGRGVVGPPLAVRCLCDS